ncbi:tripartite motif-containing protein 2-like isoform X2 [Watersipora subatra]
METEKRVEEGNVNNNGEDCCGYCYETVDYMIDPRVLPCCHVFCLPCLQADLLKNKILECHVCKRSLEDVEVNQLEKVEKLVLSDSTEDDSPPLYCDICKAEQELAITFCVDCGKKMCLKHDEHHDEYQKLFARYEHKKVSEEEYKAAPGRYEVQHCSKHKEEELKKACINCMKTFCYGCDTEKKCSAIKDSAHELEEISDLSEKFKGQLSKVMNQLSSKVADVYSLEQETSARRQEVNNKTNEMNEQIDRVLEEQIAMLKQKATLLKEQVKVYREESDAAVGEFIETLHKRKAALSSLWKMSNKALTNKHDVDIIQSYKKMMEEILTAANMELGNCQLPVGKMLIATEESTSLRLQLQDSIPQRLDLQIKEKKPVGHCASVLCVSSQSLLCGKNSSISMLDSTDFKTVILLSNSSNVNGVAPHKQGYLAFHWENSKNYIVLYSKQLKFLMLFGEFFRSTDKYSQLCTVQGKVVAVDPDEKRLNVYNEKGEFMFHTKLVNDKRPWGVQGTPDGNVLISDFGGGCVRKYRLVAGSERPVWVSHSILAPVGIAVDLSGLIFVASYSGKRIYVLSPEGVKLKELTHPMLQSVEEVYDIAISGDKVNLACGTKGVLQFKMMFDALVH